MSIAAENRETCLKVTDLKMYFPVKSGIFSKARSLKAVDGVSFSIAQGETMGLVGESGCGKTTVGRTILKLYEATGGSIVYKGTDITGFDDQEMRPYRRKMQMIFQDPYASLNPRQRVEEIIMEPMLFHGIAKDRKDAREQCMDILNRVGLRPEQAGRYPHQFSGGQRQRIGIARALAVKPEFIIADEPVSALDVSVRAQVLNLIQDLQKTKKLTYLFISHDLSVVKYVSDRIAVMYLGRIVEIATKDELYNNPQHPYTKALLSAIPIPDVDNKMKREILTGDVPSPLNPPAGCYFHTRCRYASERCSAECPKLHDIGNGHMVSCHLCE